MQWQGGCTNARGAENWGRDGAAAAALWGQKAMPMLLAGAPCGLMSCAARGRDESSCCCCCCCCCCCWCPYSAAAAAAAAAGQGAAYSLSQGVMVCSQLTSPSPNHRAAAAHGRGRGQGIRRDCGMDRCTLRQAPEQDKTLGHGRQASACTAHGPQDSRPPTGLALAVLHTVTAMNHVPANLRADGCVVVSGSARSVVHRGSRSSRSDAASRAAVPSATTGPGPGE